MIDLGAVFALLVIAALILSLPAQLAGFALSRLLRKSQSIAIKPGDARRVGILTPPLLILLCAAVIYGYNFSNQSWIFALLLLIALLVFLPNLLIAIWIQKQIGHTSEKRIRRQRRR
jgi:hypothetical protein